MVVEAFPAQCTANPAIDCALQAQGCLRPLAAEVTRGISA